MECCKVSCLNPHNRELNCKSATVAIIISALAAIAMVAGVLAILSSQGFDIGALNVLSKLGVVGGAPLAAIGGLTLIITLAWIISRVKQSLRNRSLFFDKPSDKTQTTHFKTLIGKTFSLHCDKDKTTVSEIQSKLARLMETRGVRLIYSSAPINDNGDQSSTKWTSVVNADATVHVLIKSK